MTQDFTEKIALLLLTGLLTGFLVPYILKKIEERKARQSKIIEAQSKFLDDFAQMLWKWRYMSIKVAYYASTNNVDEYNSAKKHYELNIWESFNQIRKEISTSRRLISDAGFNELLSLYGYIVNLDKRISSLIVTGGLNETTRTNAKDINDFIYSDATEKLDKILDYLADELRLKVANLKKS